MRMYLQSEAERTDLVEWLGSHAGEEDWPDGCEEAADWLCKQEPGMLTVPRKHVDAIAFVCNDWAEYLRAGDEDFESYVEDAVTCPSCGAVEGGPTWGTVGDGYGGYCPSCADAREGEET